MKQRDLRMKDLRHSPPSTTIKDTDNKSEANTPSERNVDAETIKNNPKVDAQLISDFYHLVDAAKGVIRRGRGANYGLSHPLDSKIVPTDDPRQDEEGLKEVKKTRT
ncbi:MAG: hypothetical protein OXU51_01545 [Candidatus Poribacteria bacterium]|nr:hypothetical protein [Candidatus Poribacteria bacterium]